MLVVYILSNVCLRVRRLLGNICMKFLSICIWLTHWGRGTHICVGNLTIIGSDDGLLPCRRQAIVWTNDEILLIGPLGANFSEIIIEIHTVSLKHAFKNVVWKIVAICLSLNVLKIRWLVLEWQDLRKCVLMTALTHWDRVTHICVRKLTIIGSENGLSPERRQSIIRTNAGILLIGPLRTNFSEILIEIQTFSLKKIRLKVSSAKCCSSMC